MKYAVGFLLVFSISNSFAIDYDSATKKHKFKKETQTIALTWKIVGNPQVVCDNESRKRGNSGFAYAVQACSFWTQDTCTIVISEKTNMHTLGHELMHCIKGDWHPQ